MELLKNELNQKVCYPFQVLLITNLQLLTDKCTFYVFIKILLN